MSDLHPETVTRVRRTRPDLDDLPDEAVIGLSVAHLVSLRLYLRDLGRAMRAAWKP